MAEYSDSKELKWSEMKWDGYQTDLLRSLMVCEMWLFMKLVNSAQMLSYARSERDPFLYMVYVSMMAWKHDQ